MVGGISVLKNSYYFRTKYAGLEWDYFKTKLAYAKYKKENGKSGAEKNFLRVRAVSVPILLYHGVIEDPSWQSDEVSVRLADFREQLFALKSAGWQTVSLEDYLSFTRGEKELPEKSFLITFDDGRGDSFYPVDPILRELDYTAVMFIITNRMFFEIGEEGNFHLSQTEFQKMMESGRWEMASHGRDDHDPIIINQNGDKGHYLSNRMWLSEIGRLETEEEQKKRIYNDFLSSKADIEKKLGARVSSFAYPFGDFGETFNNFPESRGLVIDEARKVYDLSFCQTASGDFPANYREGSFLAKRVSVSSKISAQELLGMFESNKDKPAQYWDDFSQNQGWIGGWGEMKIDNGTMEIRNSPSEDSALAFLNGSYLWKDYSTRAKIKINKNGKASLAVRYHDGNNYISCDYSAGSVAMTQKINKQLVFEEVVLLDTRLSQGEETSVGVSVRENKATCYLGEKEIISGEISEELKSGGIGFKIWDPVEKDSALFVEEVSVESIK